MSVSSTPAPAVDPQQTEAAFLIAHYGLPGVILSTRTSHGRGLPRARELPALPVAPRRTPQVIDAETLQPVDPPAPRIPDVIAEAARRAPPGSRFLVFVGRLFPGADTIVRDQLEARGVIDVPATEVR